MKERFHHPETLSHWDSTGKISSSTIVPDRRNIVKGIFLLLISGLLSLAFLVANSIPAQASSLNPDIIAISGQDFRFTIARDAFGHLEGDRLSYRVSGLPPGFTLRDRTIAWHPDRILKWSCETPFDSTIAGYYPLTLVATNEREETEMIELNLQILMAPFIVDLDATRHFRSTYACRRNLPAGTYKIHVINKQEGGRFDAWSRKTTWEQSYYVHPQIGRVKPVGRYPTLQELFKHPMPDRILELPIPADVSFYLVDKVNPDNNQGGLSLRVTQVD